MTLREYRRKRDFAKTPEPPGDDEPAPRSRKASGPESGRFVVQRHRATRLHYDLDPKQRRLAVHVEDHPVAYFGFEGVIPGRQYGAGDVIVWDWGRWHADPSTPDPGAALEAGELKVRLEGRKLHGGFVLIRTERWRGKATADKTKWLLIHRRDEAAQPGWDAEDHPLSVKTGRTNDEVWAGVRPQRTHRAPRRR
jgi:bifunctional non-homologous end joining protein LigD